MTGLTATRPATGRWLLTAVALAGFLTTLDNTVVTVALPSIQRDLGASLAALEWVATGYLLTFAGLMPAGGRLADVWGHRTTLLTGLMLFTSASFAAGLAGTVGPLVAARLVQGAGAALVLPATLAVLAVLDERRRSAGVAVWMASGAAALALGPVVGGYLSQHAHWSWVFLVNVPLGAAVVALAAVAVPASRPVRRALDVPGALASAVFLASGTFALIHGGEHGYGSPAVVAALALCAGGGAAFAVAERRAADPMVDLRLFAVRAFAGGVAAQVLWGLGVNGVFFYTAIFLQGVLGVHADRVGARVRAAGAARGAGDAARAASGTAGGRGAYRGGRADAGRGRDGGRGDAGGGRRVGAAAAGRVRDRDRLGAHDAAGLGRAGRGAAGAGGGGGRGLLGEQGGVRAVRDRRRRGGRAGRPELRRRVRHRAARGGRAGAGGRADRPEDAQVTRARGSVVSVLS
ncbi:MFS transporter [Nonomuraea wenchangensis]